VTVTGTFLDANDQPRVEETVRFLNETSPQADPLGVITARIVEVVLDEHGVMDPTVLEQGTYLVHVGFGKRDWFRILVDGTADAADINSLLIAQNNEDLDQDGVNYRVKSGFLQIKNVDTGAWHTVQIVGQPGLEQLEIVVPGNYTSTLAAGNNYRVLDDQFQLLNVDTLLFHTIQLVGQPGAEQFEIVVPGVA
jgi:hypothetical protein